MPIKCDRNADHGRNAVFTLKAKTHIPQLFTTLEAVMVPEIKKILFTSQNRFCDLIIKGYHVPGKLGEAFSGSTTRMVLRRSHVPVLLVRLPVAAT